MLDGQGVIFDSPIKQFLARFASAHRVDYEDIERKWETRLRELAWRGQVSDEQLWHELAGRPVDARQIMLWLRTMYRPGPAERYLAGWAKIVPIWMLSNHRSAWLLPRLESRGLTQVLDKILISDRTGFIKPEPEAFELLLEGKRVARDILFVDDQLHNVEAAESLGCRVVLAASGQPWLDRVNVALGA